MNANHTSSMSPNTFRRLLVAHGRTTTPGVFDSEVPHKQEQIVKELLEKKKNSLSEGFSTKDNVEPSPQELEVVKKPVETEPQWTKQVGSLWPQTGALINPPLSKIKSTKPKLASSYSFYTRPFKVHGKEAWEFAMRGLGSVDTLLNRYGYVEPLWRGDIYQTPLELQQKEVNATKSEIKSGKVTKNENRGLL